MGLTHSQVHRKRKNRRVMGNCDKEHNGSWDVCFCFPARIYLHLLEGAVAFTLVERDLDRAVRVIVFVGMTVLFGVVFSGKTPKFNGWFHSQKYPLASSLSKAVRLRQLQILTDVTKEFLNGGKCLVGCDIRFSLRRTSL